MKVKARANVVFNMLTFINYDPIFVEYTLVKRDGKLSETFYVIDSSNATGMIDYR